MYERFYKELYQAGGYKITETYGGTEYILVHYKEAGMADERGFVVTYDDPYTIKCTCGLYGHVGMLCRHALKVRSERQKYETYIKNAQQYH
jgi:hypothetical protein